jgi:hypothetical protein
VTTGGNFNAADQRTTFMNYNPGSVLPGTNNPWVLGTYTEQSVVEGGQTIRSQACFDPANSAMGTGPAATAVGVLIHEVAESAYKQFNNLPSVEVTSAGLDRAPGAVTLLLPGLEPVGTTTRAAPEGLVPGDVLIAIDPTGWRRA